MSKNNPVWPQVKRSFGTFVDKARRTIGKVIVIGAGSAVCLYSMYEIAFSGVMAIQRPSLIQIVVGCIGLCSYIVLGILTFLYFILKVVPFIWNGFHIRDLKL